VPPVPPQIDDVLGFMVKSYCTLKERKTKQIAQANGPPKTIAVINPLQLSKSDYSLLLVICTWVCNMNLIIN
jgi:hypothetical protein